MNIASRMTAFRRAGKPYSRELAYLERDQGPYIDTGLFIGGKYQVQMKAQFPSSVSYDVWLCGSWNNIGGSKDFLIGYYGGIRAQCGVDSSINYSTTIPNDNLPHVLGIMRDRFVVDDLQQTTYPDYNSLPYNAESTKLVLFKSWHVDNRSGTKRIYWTKIWDMGDKLVRDFIPVMSLDEEPCMYDRVTHGLYRNAGTGTFRYGEIS